MKKDIDSSKMSEYYSTKRQEQWNYARNRDYDKAYEIEKEITEFKKNSRKKLHKFNNMTLSETLVLSTEIMEYLSSDLFTKENCDYGISSFSQEEQYELLKNIVEWYLLPKDKVNKVIAMNSYNKSQDNTFESKSNPALKIITMIISNIKDASRIFFDLIKRLLNKKNQSHRKIFATLEPFIEEMSVPNILKELLNRLEIPDIKNEMDIE
jgi:hypothetical protein